MLKLQKTLLPYFLLTINLFAIEIIVKGADFSAYDC